MKSCYTENQSEHKSFVVNMVNVITKLSQDKQHRQCPDKPFTKHTNYCIRRDFTFRYLPSASLRALSWGYISDVMLCICIYSEFRRFWKSIFRNSDDFPLIQPVANPSDSLCHFNDFFVQITRPNFTWNIICLKKCDKKLEFCRKLKRPTKSAYKCETS